MNKFQQYLEYLPLVVEWVKQQEQYILDAGIPLNNDQKIDAHLIGIRNIDKVRLLEVDRIPNPQNPILQKLGKEVGLLSEHTIGVSFRYGIYVKKGYLDQRTLIAHELVHTMQYERLGSIENFLKEYITECILVGYPNGKLEMEARNFESKFDS